MDLGDMPFGVFEPPPARFSERMKFLPIAYVVLAMLMLGSIYLCQHIFPLLTQKDAFHPDPRAEFRGWCQLAIFVPTTVMLVICYVRSILTHPGEIPEDPKWEYLPRQQNAAPLTVQETKRSGERRHCKWCGKFKPDRCHHCRVCRTCVLKMDHHCPWIYNCVGFYNYKFFILLLVYSAIDCYLILFTMAESVHRCIYDGAAAFGDLFLVFFGQFLALVLAGLVSAFLGMHLWLIARGMTTIEFCEKFVPKDGSSKAFANSLYDLGVFRNFKATMGQNVAVWFLPIGVPDGDGLTFLCDETRLTQDHDAFCKTPEPSQLSRPPWTLYGTERWVDQPIDSP
ncbi:unnamed protein product [Durusdinium trenchii]|uniref:Uncharacterized protein n=2 Tax=Durusdinium trenchii TaxID=1381693 RepID=A0ABP0PHV5_9DINO